MAINPLMLPQIIAMGGAAQPMQQPMTPQPMQQPMTPQMPQPQQGPDSLAELTRLLGGDLSGSLSSGDKLLALSGLLRSATRSGRRAGLTPEQVISGLQQRKVAEVQNRLAIEQMRAAQAQRQQQLQMVNEYAGALDDPKQRAALMALGPEKAAEKMAEVAFRQRQVQQILTDEAGKSRIVFGDGSEGTLSFNVERGAKWIKGDPMNTGTEVLVKVDEKTEEPIRDKNNQFQTMAIGTSWADQQRIALETQRVAIARANAAREAAGGEGGASGDGKVRTIVYTLPGRAAPQVGRGYVLPGGFVRPIDGPMAGRVVPQAKSGSGNDAVAAAVAEELARRR